MAAHSVEQALRQVPHEHSITALKRGFEAQAGGTGLAVKHSRHMESETHADPTEAHASVAQARHMGEINTPPPSGGGGEPPHMLEVQAQGEAPQEAPVGPLEVPT